MYMQVKTQPSIAPGLNINRKTLKSTTQTSPTATYCAPTLKETEILAGRRGRGVKPTAAEPLLLLPIQEDWYLRLFES